MTDGRELIPPTPEQAVSAGFNYRSAAQLLAGVGIAFGSLYFPPTALAGPVVTSLIDKYVKGPERILNQKLKEKGVDQLTEEQALAFFPMAYRFYEQAKQGEYQENLRIIGEYIAQTLVDENPDANKVARMSRKIENLSSTDLKVIALVHRYSQIPDGLARIAGEAEGVVLVNSEVLYPIAGSRIPAPEIRESLNELSTRNFLVPDAGTRLGKKEEWYITAPSLDELVRASEELRNLRP